MQDARAQHTREQPRSLGASLRRLVGAAADATTVRRVRRKVATDRLDELELVVHRGYGTREWLRVQARVLEARGVTPGTVTDPWWRNVAAAFNRFVSLEVPGALVRLTVDGQRRDAHTDLEGYVRFEVPNTQPDAHGWRTAHVELLGPFGRDQREERATGRILVPDPRTRLGVISDVDDTVLHTGLTETAGMLRTTLLHNAATRLPYPGVAAFYRALRDGVDGVQRPIFYVSGSPWNLYDMLVRFFTIQDIPPGPLFLKDWGIDEHKFIREDTREYKLDRITRLLDVYPDLDFVLIGDSGQEDPEIYAEAIARAPDRFAVVYIRDVTSDPARDRAVHTLLETLRAHDVPAVFSGSTVDAAEDAAERGLIAKERLADVRRGEDHDRPA